MAVDKAQVLTALRRVRGPDLTGNIVDLGLISDIVERDGKVYFSITVAASRARDLEELRLAAEKVVAGVPGVKVVVATLQR
jgi:ATP-binding protein involved in chromosome partitioning